MSVVVDRTVAGPPTAAPAPPAPAGRPQRLSALLPGGAPLAEDVLASRHRLLTRLLGAHVPVLVVLAALHHNLVSGLALVAPVLACLALAVVAPQREGSAGAHGGPSPRLYTGPLAVSVGLAFCSLAVIVDSGGNLTTHLHVVLMVSAVALYQDTTALLGFLTAIAVLLEACSAVSPASLFGSTGTAANNPALASAVDLLAVVLVAAALLTFWRATEQQTRTAAELATRLERAELAAAQADATRQHSTSVLLSHLARRNQSLLARQISQLARLNSSGRRSEIHELTFLASRMRRNADSLLVLSGQDARGRFGRPEVVSTLLRGVASGAPDPASVELVMRMDATIAGRAAADVTHVLEELLDNALAACASPRAVRPGAPVTLEAGRAIDGRYLIVVVDHGCGLRPAELAAANSELSTVDLSTPAVGDRFGFQVIARLAERHGLTVSLAPGQDGGLVALVGVPDALLAPAPPAPSFGA